MTTTLTSINMITLSHQSYGMFPITVLFLLFAVFIWPFPFLSPSLPTPTPSSYCSPMASLRSAYRSRLTLLAVFVANGGHGPRLRCHLASHAHRHPRLPANLISHANRVASAVLACNLIGRCYCTADTVTDLIAIDRAHCVSLVDSFMSVVSTASPPLMLIAPAVPTTLPLVILALLLLPSELTVVPTIAVPAPTVTVAVYTASPRDAATRAHHGCTNRTVPAHLQPPCRCTNRAVSIYRVVLQSVRCPMPSSSPSRRFGRRSRHLRRALRLGHNSRLYCSRDGPTWAWESMWAGSVR